MLTYPNIMAVLNTLTDLEIFYLYNDKKKHNLKSLCMALPSSSLRVINIGLSTFPSDYRLHKCNIIATYVFIISKLIYKSFDFFENVFVFIDNIVF